MGFVSSKQILLNNSILNSNNSNNDNNKKKSNRQEFQAFAYRIASDLNDLSNLLMYLRLVKRIDRTIIEEAYRFAVDSKSANKSKLFLWKLKQINETFKKKVNSYNFSLNFVLKQTKRAKDIFCQKLINNLNVEFNVTQSFFEIVFEKLNSIFTNDEICTNSIKKNILLIGAQPMSFYHKFCDQNKFRFLVLEISRNVARKFRDEIKRYRTICNSITLLNVDFFKKDFRNIKFDLILFEHFWKVVPLNSEIKFLNKLVDVSNKNALLSFSFKPGDSNSEEWQLVEFEKNVNNLNKVNVNNLSSNLSKKTEIIYLYKKVNQKEKVLELLDKFKLKIILTHQLNQSEYVLCQKMYE
ncbi:MAG: hypothetical protein NZZ41_06535 [Candidatus Dojkabacteria bacterium]|nr:hypothetical protein [Candidatus Dojkabacteria bacterium]